MVLSRDEFQLLGSEGPLLANDRMANQPKLTLKKAGKRGTEETEAFNTQRWMIQRKKNRVGPWCNANNWCERGKQAGKQASRQAGKHARVAEQYRQARMREGE